MTSLERSVLIRMILEEIKDPERARFLVQKMRPKGRTLSPDVLDVHRCAGFYLDLYECDLKEIAPEKSRLNAQAAHSSLSVGADFILFRYSSEGPVLEASFFGESVAIDQLLSVDHGFILK
ncbi:hypothetical protein [Massilia genomosp. 1]|uniref:Uncharacterized protein n=1 Tax=Massilia genomosp. 1 TaxID=2609280 RepID=A0ABX0N097_9BURK|nr:hypothetical protein [Massilia genomosp. 1]NHZ66460.1 hypothetical protein [Massilia genomosp. 1]